MKGLICAGGTATRLEELTRVTNKHLLPVGRWPMVYYPLQLLQRLGVREVLLVTGQQHAGQFIDLLGNGQRAVARRRRAAVRPRSLVQGAGRGRAGSRRSSGWRATSPRGDQLVVCLGDNIFEHAQADAIGVVAATARSSSSRRCPDPENFGVVAYDDDGERRRHRREGRRRRHALRRRRRRATRSSGLYCYPPDVFEIIDGLQPSSRGELEITDVNRVYAQRGDLEVRRVEGWWHDGGKHWADLAERRPADRGDGREQVSRSRASRSRATRTSAAGSRS